MQLRPSFWSLDLVKLRGVAIKVNISLLLMLLWLAMGDLHGPAARHQHLLAPILAGSLILHEIAHNLVAAAFRVRLVSLTLFPFGGVYAATSGEVSPWRELSIWLAGPLANLMIGSLALLSADAALRSAGGASLFADGTFDSAATLLQSPAGLIAAINLAIGIVNLLPAAPFDGARVAHAILALSRASSPARTSIAISQVLAFVALATAIRYGNLGLGLLSIWFFVNSIHENVLLRTHVAVAGRKVGEFMLPRERLVEARHGLTLEQAARELLPTVQDHFVVLHGDTIVGILSREDLLRALASSPDNRYITEILDREPLTAHESSALAPVLERAAAAGAGIVVVTDEERRYRGVIVPRRLLEQVLVSRIHDDLRHDSANDDFF